MPLNPLTWGGSDDGRHGFTSDRGKKRPDDPGWAAPEAVSAVARARSAALEGLQRPGRARDLPVGDLGEVVPDHGFDLGGLSERPEHARGPRRLVASGLGAADLAE